MHLQTNKFCVLLLVLFLIENGHVFLGIKFFPYFSELYLVPNIWC